MCNLGNRPSPPPCDDRVLAQHALACELSGDLEHAVALVRCLQRRGADQPVPAADRRIA
jgi:hypothetical protein